jgi:hypothetical protein
MLIAFGASVTHGQIGDPQHSVKVARPLVKGLPLEAKVNPTMFFGIELTPVQGDAIARLALRFFAEDSVRGAKHPVPAPLDSMSKVRLLPVLNVQRRAYRAVLTQSQRKIFDQNVAALLHAWLTSNPPRKEGIQ